MATSPGQDLDDAEDHHRHQGKHEGQQEEPSRQEADEAHA